MNNSLNFLISAIAMVGSLALANAPNTYYIEIDGRDSLREKIFQKLSAKPCFTIADIEPGSTLKECHAFLPATKNTKLSHKGEFLFKVKIKEISDLNKPRFISLQGYKSNGKKPYRYFNPGTFSIPSEHQIQTGKADYSEDKFVEQSTSTIVGLSFK